MARYVTTSECPHCNADHLLLSKLGGSYGEEHPSVILHCTRCKKRLAEVEALEAAACDLEGSIGPFVRRYLDSPFEVHKFTLSHRPWIDVRVALCCPAIWLSTLFLCGVVALFAIASARG